MSKSIITLIFVLFLSSCCSKKATSQKTEQKQTLTGKWQVENVGKSKSKGKMPTLTFEDGQIHGNAGCNNYSSDITIKGNEITFGFFMKTKMYCDNMKTEKAFIDKLQKVTTYKIENDKLKLYSEAGKELLSFTAIK